MGSKLVSILLTFGMSVAAVAQTRIATGVSDHQQTLELMFSEPLRGLIWSVERGTNSWGAWLTQPAGAPYMHLYCVNQDGRWWQQKIGSFASISLVDVEGDGTSELLVTDGREVCAISPFRGPRECESLFSTDSLAQIGPRRLGGSFDPNSELRDPDVITLESLGQIDLYRRVPNHGFHRYGSIDLPTQGTISDSGWSTANLQHQLIHESYDRWRVILGPEPLPPQRLKSKVIEFSPELQEPEGFEAWSKLPAPMAISSYRYILLGGRLFLVLLALDFGDRSIHQDRQIIVFPLQQDRSRTGSEPVFRAYTGCESYPWSMKERLQIVDIDYDSQEDLVVLCANGRLSRRFEIFGFRSGRNNMFNEPRSVFTFRLDKDPIDGWFGGDINGDGQPDLAILTWNELTIYYSRRGSEQETEFLQEPDQRIRLNNIESAQEEDVEGIFRLGFLPNSYGERRSTALVSRRLKNSERSYFSLIPIAPFGRNQDGKNP